MKYARIESGRVAETAEFDSIEGRFHPDLVWVKCGAEVREGYTFTKGKFTAPPAPEATPAPVPIKDTAEAEALREKLGLSEPELELLAKLVRGG